MYDARTMLQTCIAYLGDNNYLVPIIILHFYMFYTHMIMPPFVVEGIECFDVVTHAVSSNGAIVRDSLLRNVTMDKPRLSIPTVAAVKWQLYHWT